MSELNDSNPISEPQQAESTVSESHANTGTPRSKRTNGVLIGVIAVLLCVVGVMAYAMLRPKPTNERVTDGRATFVTPDNVEEVLKQLSEPIQDAYYTTAMSVDWYFDNAAAVSTSAYVENDVDNTRTVYFDVNLENGDLVLSSPYLPVGARMDQIQLDKKDLAAGDYPAVCTYYLVDDDNEVITHVSVAITIHILN